MESVVKRISLLVLPLNLVMLGSPAHAHRPTMSDGTAVDAEHAIEFQDVQISRVVYHEVTEYAPWVWITFEIDHSQELFLQIGVPILDRLREYRPCLALLGPGLPEVSVPFEFPSGLGGLILDTRQIENPREFYEPFTSTRSWILTEQDVQLPEAGRYYVVAYNPQGALGKLWAALGRKEVWSVQDMLKMPKIIADVGQFHEVATVSDAASKSGDERIVFDFDGAASSGKWISVNDEVMGGVSEGAAHITDDGILRFTGRISLENNGGFASIVARTGSMDLSAYDELLIRVRGDDKRCAISLQTDYTIMGGAYYFFFQAKEGDWQEIRAPLSDFRARSFGSPLGQAPPLNARDVRELGFMISDKQKGPYRIEVDWIKVVKSADRQSGQAEKLKGKK
jgi:hypothetical protein